MQPLFLQTTSVLGLTVPYIYRSSRTHICRFALSKPLLLRECHLHVTFWLACLLHLFVIKRDENVTCVPKTKPQLVSQREIAGIYVFVK